MTTGILDEDTAWRCLLRYRLGMPEARPSVSDLIEWAADGSGRSSAVTNSALGINAIRRVRAGNHRV